MEFEVGTISSKFYLWGGGDISRGVVPRGHFFFFLRNRPLADWVRFLLGTIFPGDDFFSIRNGSLQNGD